LILRSNLFFSEHAVGQRIKSPVELAVGLVRELGLAPAMAAVGRELVNLGQQLDAPPTEQGWAGGADWINSFTLLLRLQLLQRLIEGGGDFGRGVELAGAGQGTEAAEAWMERLLQVPLAAETRDAVRALAAGESRGSAGMRRVLAAVASQPEYQLC
jgi:uncharacterized protein (DUF1800 family)